MRQINLCRADRWHCTKEYYWFLKKLGQKKNDDLISEYLCKDRHSTDNDMLLLDL